MAQEAAAWLDGINLGQYADALAADGYEDVLSFKSMTQDEVMSVSKSCGMKPGQCGKFRAGVQALQSNAANAAPLWCRFFAAARHIHLRSREPSLHFLNTCIELLHLLGPLGHFPLYFRLVLTRCPKRGHFVQMFLPLLNF